MIDNAEDRMKFSDMVDEIGVQQPCSREPTIVDSAFDFAANVGYPGKLSFVYGPVHVNVHLIFKQWSTSIDPTNSTCTSIIHSQWSCYECCLDG